jgi:peptide/nickel transport system substrate-binding protein
VVLHATDSTLINPISLVVIGQLKRAGFNVDVWASDWASVSQRRLNREPVERGGWSLVPVVWQGADLFNPLANYAVAYNCNSAGYPGWYCDPEMTPLIQQFAATGDEAERRDLARRIQLRVHEHVTLGFLGQFAVPGGYRSNLRGVLEVGFPVLWNISRAN